MFLVLGFYETADWTPSMSLVLMPVNNKFLSLADLKASIFS